MILLFLWDIVIFIIEIDIKTCIRLRGVARLGIDPQKHLATHEKDGEDKLVKYKKYMKDSK